MTQERKLPVKQKAYSLFVRPIARVVMVVVFLAAILMVGLFIGRGRISADFIAVNALLCIVIVTVALAISSMHEKGIDRTRQKVLRAIVQHLFVVNIVMLAVLILTTVILALTGHLTLRPMLVWIPASLFLSVIFLGRLRWSLARAKEAPKLIQKGP
jgi:hypothetical protein